MGKVNPNDIVRYAKKAESEGWGYIWGTAGEMWTEKKQIAVERDPKGREQTKKYGRKWIDHNVADCSGLIKWIFKQLGLDISHGSNSQYMNYCTKKGKIEKDTVLMPGCGVFKYDASLENPYYHVGVYIGDGKVIEAQGTYKGVIKTGLFGWTHYGYWKYANWEEGKMDDLKRGSSGGAVIFLQNDLNRAGYDCGTVDGIFGEKTERAVKAFQAANGLTADGIVGEGTWEKLNALKDAKPVATMTDIPVPQPQQPVVHLPQTIAFTGEQYNMLLQSRDLLIKVLGNG